MNSSVVVELVAFMIVQVVSFMSSSLQLIKCLHFKNIVLVEKKILFSDFYYRARVIQKKCKPIFHTLWM